MTGCSQFYERLEEMLSVEEESDLSPKKRMFIEFCMKDPSTRRALFNFMQKMRPVFQMLTREEESHGKV